MIKNKCRNFQNYRNEGRMWKQNNALTTTDNFEMKATNSSKN